MRTVSTKLDRKDHERLLEMCNDEGKSVAEELREMVQMSCDAWDEGKEIKKKRWVSSFETWIFKAICFETKMFKNLTQISIT